MYIHVYAYIYIYIRMYRYTYVYIYMYISTFASLSSEEGGIFFGKPTHRVPYRTCDQKKTQQYFHLAKHCAVQRTPRLRVCPMLFQLTLARNHAGELSTLQSHALMYPFHYQHIQCNFCSDDSRQESVGRWEACFLHMSTC